MRLLVDCLVVKAHQAGLRSYAHSLVHALASRPDVEVTVLTSTDTKGDWGLDVDVLEVSVGKNGPLNRAIWRRRNLRRTVRSLGVEAVLTVSPEWAPAGVPTIVVVHDLGPAVAPGLYGRKRSLRYALTLNHTVSKASAVIAVSGSTKLDLIRWVGTEIDKKVFVVRNSSQELPSSGDLPRNMRDVESFALYVGAHLPHKNVRTILRLFDQQRSTMPSTLVCVGPDYGGEKAEELEPYMSAPWLRSPGFVTPAELAALYEAAQVVLIPSLFEGYGLPAVEALRSGSLVVATRLAALEEVAGDWITYVDEPLSVDAWAKAIREAQLTPPSRSHDVNLGGQWGWTDAAEAVVRIAVELTGSTRTGGCG